MRGRRTRVGAVVQNVAIVPRRLSSRTFFRDPVRVAATRDGDVLELRSPRALLLRDPDEIWRVLVTDAGRFRQGKWKRRARRFLGPTLNTLDGPEHRERRLLVQPAVDRRRIAGFTDRIVARANEAQAGWRSGERFVLRERLDPLSLVMAGDALLDTDLTPQADALAAALGVVMTSVPRLMPPVRGTRHARALADVHRAARALLADVGHGDEARSDLPALLLRGGLTERVAVGEVTAFLLAAVDEPPSGLAAAWFFLAGAPEVEARLLAELEGVLGDRAVTADDDERLPYLDAIVRESLRLLPPARHIDRCPVADSRIGGVDVREGTNVLISPLVTHHDPALFERPEAFVPERWLGGESTPTAARHGYFPFGAGPHTCVGEPLARAIMCVTLATIARRWRLLLDDDAHAPVPGAPPLYVTLEER